MREFLTNLYRYGLEYYNKYYGLYRGEVISNSDPKVLGRLVVRVPQLHGTDYPNYWAPSKGMPTGNQMALWILPNPGDLVWVTFENGDTRFPVWEYGPFGNPDVVPEPAKKPNNYFFQTPKGKRIEFDEEADTVTILGNNGSVIQLVKDGRISIKNGNDNLKEIIRDMLITTAGLDIITPSGAGTVGPTSVQEIMNLQTRLLKLLK